jgi:glycosyltransferase involved in cell wall biosynthesis
MVLREGMAAGLPALSTQLLGLHETVTPETGLLVRADDPAALADGMEHMLNLAPADYRTMAQAARQRAESLFSLDHQVGLLSKWMQQVHDGKQRRQPTPARHESLVGRTFLSASPLIPSPGTRGEG